MKIGILSDTHNYLHSQIFTFFASCDELWHAGDIGNINIAEQLQSFKPLRAVYGNIDGTDIRSHYGEYTFFEAGGLQVLMMHAGGYPPIYNPRGRELLEQYNPDIMVCGHSHILKILNDNKRKLLYINAGAAGNQGFHKAITFLRFDIENKRPANMEIFHEDRK
jgi:putative phosphoesterase